MNHPITQLDVPTSATPNGDAVQCLSELRTSLRKLRGPGDLTALLPILSSSVDQVMAEHKGMAEELLCLYEQLGIIFEVTRKLAGVQNESEVLGHFLDSIHRSFEGRVVCAAHRRRSGEWMMNGRVGDGDWGMGIGGLNFDAPNPKPDTPEPMLDNEWLRSLLDRACESRAVIVEPYPPSATWGKSEQNENGEKGMAPTMPVAIAEVMIAPILSGDIVVCSLVLLRTQQTPSFQASEMLLVESLAAFCGDLIRSHRLVGELREMSIALVRALVNAVDQKDPYTCGHSLRVAYYATTLGQHLGLGEVDLQMLQWASLLHDIGKIGIRDDVLKKEGKLTPEEFDHIKEHPIRSHKVVQEVPQLLQALDGILHHHERYDGSGYPAGLKGEQIPLQARIVQIADVFDALTSNRSYRKAFDWQRALGILQEEAGMTVDPSLQKTFDAMIHETLKDDPSAWERMVERANRFMQDMNAPVMSNEEWRRSKRGNDEGTHSIFNIRHSTFLKTPESEGE